MIWIHFVRFSNMIWTHFVRFSNMIWTYFVRFSNMIWIRFVRFSNKCDLSGEQDAFRAAHSRDKRPGFAYPR